LVVAQISVNGIVVTASGRIAVVSMAGRNRAYFLRERDQLFNGAVSKIGDDSVIFRERTRDAFGREYEREVVKQVVAGTTRPGARR
jgi:type II secretory pathway component PulC